MIVIVDDVRDVGMHTFTVYEVPIRGKTFILATESMPQGCTDLFSNIEDVALFLFWKFAHYDPQNDRIQISYALLYSPLTFKNTTMLTASLTAARSSLAEKLKGMEGYRPSRSCSNNHVNYSDNMSKANEELICECNDNETMEASLGALVGIIMILYLKGI